MQWLHKIGWLNLMLVFAPIALVLKYTGGDPVWIFVTASAAIVPLAGLMGKSTEMLAHRLGPGIGGLLNASFGNAAELIIAIFALKKGLVGVVKASLTGSILGNILLVLGAAFLAGGLRHRKQKFNATAAGMSATLLALAAVGLLVPAIFHAHLMHQQLVKEGQTIAVEQDVSLEIAIVLFGAYVLMLLFSLKTHSHLYNMEDAHGDGTREESPHETDEHFHDVVPPWSMGASIGVLVAATTAVAVMSEVLVGAIEETAHTLGWTELFVGVIVVAIVGNAAEHSTAVLAAWKNRMELGFQIAVGSGLQIALFVAPLLLFISYLPGFPRLDLVFSMLEVVAVGSSVLLLGMVAHDGESNWLEGLLLLAVYVILGIAFYHLPGH